MKKGEVVGPRSCKPEDLAIASQLIMGALKEILEEAYPPVEVITEGIIRSIADIKQYLKRGIDESVNLSVPGKFDERASACVLIVDDFKFSGASDMERLELVPVVREGDEKIPGTELIKRAQAECIDFGRIRGQYFIDHWWDIPECMVTFIKSQLECGVRVQIALPGTMWIGLDGEVFIPAITFGNPVSYPRCEIWVINGTHQFGSEWYFMRMKAVN